MLNLILRELGRNKLSIGIILFSILIYITIILNISRVESILQSIVLRKSFESIEAFSESVLNVLSRNITYEDLQQENIIKKYGYLTEILETLSFDTVKYVFIVRKENEKFLMLIDASKQDRQPPYTPIQLLPEEEMIINSVLTTKKSDILTHQDIDTIGITLYKPFIKEGKVIGVLILDFSLKKLKEISNMIDVLKRAVLVLIGVSILSLNLIVIPTLIAVYHRKKSIVDSLTGLYNRTFLEELRQILNIQDYVVVLVDIDFFKKINDTYGHDTGDKVLKTVSNIFREKFRKEDIVIRYGGEEFLILLKKSRRRPEELLNAIERLRKHIEEHKIKISETDYLKVTISAGVNLSTDKMKDIDEAIKKADIALYRAKTRGRNRIEIYDETSQVQQNIMKISQIKQALEEGRVLCVYQPIVNLSTGEISHLEALARIVDTDGSIIAPYRFINVIENTFLYTQLTKQVIEFNIDILKRHRDIKVSINLKPADILNQSTIDHLLQLPDEDIRRRLLLEIVETEDALMYEKVLDVVESLRNRGFQICVDDFGSGYSNFVYLLKLKVDYLKIDANLIRNIHTDPVSREVVTMINDFCRKMGIKVIAEFVENEDILLTLKHIGVEYGQGYYFAKPDYIQKFIG